MRTTSWKLRDGVAWTRTSYGGVLLDAVSGEYWTLNTTGAVVLTSLLSGADLDSAMAGVADAFDGAEGAVTTDVPALIAELEAAELVVQR